MMLELRLIDRDGYTVNHHEAVATVVPERADTIKADMLNRIAPQDAENWGCSLTGYRVQTTPIPSTSGFDIDTARERVYDALDDAANFTDAADAYTSLADLEVAEAAASGIDLDLLDPASGRLPFGYRLILARSI